MEGLGYLQASMITAVPLLLIMPPRLLLHARHRHRIASFDDNGHTPSRRIVWREGLTELCSWLVIGTGSGLFYLIHYHAPWTTGIKVLLGCICFGLFGGMTCFLTMEKRFIDFMIEKNADMPPHFGSFLSVAGKMMFFMVTVLVLMVVVILLMVFMDINYLLVHKEALGPEIFDGVFNEIVFAFAVLLALGLFTFSLYSRNLKTILDHQLTVMGHVSNGDYDHRIPVVSNDEFGLIAAKSNEMIQGLKERDACQVSFGRYVTPEVSEKILRGEISPEGEMSDVTILFCDLRGYTPFVERNRPTKVVQFMNTYFTKMEQAVKRYNGIVLQYIGDEIMAVFGAPIREPDHPDMAVSAALDMRERLAELNRDRESAGEPVVGHGIGIHSGEVLAGEVGSPDRLVYAMVGDAVNIASRLQSLNKRFGTDILVSGTTKKLLKRHPWPLESLGKRHLKGVSEEIEVFKAV